MFLKSFAYKYKISRRNGIYFEKCPYLWLSLKYHVLKAMKIFYLVLLLIICNRIKGQNIVNNGDFEYLRRDSIWPTGHITLNDSLYYIDSFTTDWKSLFKSPSYHNDSVWTLYNGINAAILPNPFKNHGCSWISPNYRTYDTINNSVTYLIDMPGEPNEFYSYNGYWWNNNSGLYQKLNTNLIIDTTYILSYRLKTGSEINPIYSYYDNFVNNFGVLFSTTDISNSKQYKINYYKEELQDTTLDTTYKWRLIQNEFISDSMYGYINFAQFIDIRNNKYKINRVQEYDLGGRFNEVFFALFIDDVRLLPKWQYLNTTPEVNACVGDSVKLEVYSGAGPYTWIQVDNPTAVISNSSSINIKLADTNIRYQVMSPFDTAMIPIYVSEFSYSSDTQNLYSCDSPIGISNSEIIKWYDGSIDTMKSIEFSGNYWYQTFNKCKYNTTTLDIKINHSQNDTFKIVTCDSFEYNNKKYQNSGLITIQDTTSFGCDSISVIDLTINRSSIDMLFISSCTPYLWDDSLYSFSGIYSKVFKTSNQCDSTLILDLKIGLDKKVEQKNGIEFHAVQDSAFYQWYICKPNWKKIVNETSQDLKSTTYASYAVVLTSKDGKCIDTSDCIDLYNSSIATFYFDNDIHLSPNPFKDKLKIKFSLPQNNIKIQIYDISSRKIIERIYKNKENVNLELDQLTEGVYYINIESDKNSKYFKVVKE